MANGTLAASKFEMLSQSGTGITTINPPATNTDRTLTLPDSTGTVALNGTALTLGTAVAATSGTSVDFTSIPSWAKRITVMFNGVSTNGTSLPQVQIGSGSVTTSGYVATSSIFFTSVSVSAATSGFIINSNQAAAVNSGQMVLTNVSGNVWVACGCVGNSSGTVTMSISTGNLTLGGTLDRIRITTVNGTDTFDAGFINIMYEG